VIGKFFQDYDWNQIYDKELNTEEMSKIRIRNAKRSLQGKVIGLFCRTMRDLKDKRRLLIIESWRMLTE